ncbi:MAG: DegT/DnrJ/EryC1/StrS family aminotransferase, partial [Flavobacteriaceae bacterium]|nr:DegT/DnrJ/EryC1/StrS family aminotransferase [Flavobacteriaceae bacterium]
GIGRGQMEVLDRYVKLRRENNNFYKNIFKDIKGITVFEEPSDNYFSNHWLSCIIIDKEVTGFSKEELRLALLKENIESRPLWKPMHLQPVFQKYPFYGGVVSESLFSTGLCLPSGSNLTENEKAFIANAITNYLNR